MADSLPPSLRCASFPRYRFGILFLIVLEIPDRCDRRRCQEPGFAEGETVYVNAAGSKHRAIGYHANL